MLYDFNVYNLYSLGFDSSKRFTREIKQTIRRLQRGTFVCCRELDSNNFINNLRKAFWKTTLKINMHNMFLEGSFQNNFPSTQLIPIYVSMPNTTYHYFCYTT
jgi:hypothetical protein